MRLIDANVLITAKNSYYGMSLVPQFWQWVESAAADDLVGLTDWSTTNSSTVATNSPLG